jgi:hypothetical protein
MKHHIIKSLAAIIIGAMLLKEYARRCNKG